MKALWNRHGREASPHEALLRPQQGLLQEPGSFLHLSSRDDPVPPD